jgi:hypothetical protein
MPLTSPDAWVVECNCSICARNGYLNVYVRNECVDFHGGVDLTSDLIEVSTIITLNRVHGTKTPRSNRA